MFSMETINKIYEMWENRFKMKRFCIELKDGMTGIGNCVFEYKGYVLRMNHLQMHPDSGMYLIEIADSVEQARHNDFEDSYTYDDGDYPLSELLGEMEADIISELGDITDG